MTDEQLLTLYFDGELDAEVAEELEERLATEPALQEELDALLALRAGVQGAARQELSGLDLTGFAERVMAALPPDEELEWRRAPAAERPAAPAAREGGLAAWLSRNLAPLLLGAAVAAALMLGLRLLAGEALAPSATPAAPQRVTGAQVQGSAVHIKLDAQGAQMRDEDEGEGGAGSDI